MNTSNDDRNVLLATACEGVINFTNEMVNQLPPGAREALNAAIVAGAVVKITVQLTPLFSVKGTVEAAGQVAQLFEVSFLNRPSAMLN